MSAMKKGALFTISGRTSESTEQDNLFTELMKLAFECTDAQRGFIIIRDKDELLVEIRGTMFPKEISILQSIPVDRHDELCGAIVTCVAMTGSYLLLNDAYNELAFRSDPYIVRNKPKSILCSPIINQGRLLGVLYLENNLKTCAFTINGLAVLNAMSSRVTIAIDNARILGSFHQLDNKLQKRLDWTHVLPVTGNINTI